MRLPKLAPIVLLAALAGIVSPGRAMIPPAGNTLTVSPADVRPASRIDADMEWYATAQEFYFVNTDFLNRYFRAGYAPLFLPDGARIKALSVRFLDRGCGNEQALQVVVYRQNLADGTVQELGGIDTSALEIDPARRTLTDVTIENGVVDNAVYSYSLLVQFGNIKRDRVRFHGATIFYD